ncbi:MAG TPA: NUDIX hydrolase [Devosia sp.]|nr:NUDIX hydrolase [Devosia sp.]
MLIRTDLAENIAEDSARQVAALVWRKAGKDPEILLVTSRISGHWLLPKGWPVEGKSAAESALQEAFEEAGVWGDCDDHPVGSYGYLKMLSGGAAIHCTVDVFAVEAVGVLAHWPEREQRRREWVTLTEAAARVMEPDLAEFLRRCDAPFVSQHFRAISRSDATSRPPTHVSREKETVVITAAQCRAARALIDWSADRLTAEAGLSMEQLEEFEGGGRVDPELNMRLRRALEGGGANFLSERRGRGLGVRLKFCRQVAKRIDVWENEGGPAAADDIL